LSLHEDLRNAAVEPYEHYISWGVFERRRGITEIRGAQVLSEIDFDYTSQEANYLDEFDAAQLQEAKHIDLLSRHDVTVYVHSNASYYARLIAAALAHALRSAGARCTLASDRDERPSEVTIPIVVAPHEFFDWGIPAFFRQPAFLMKSVVLNTEQVKSLWPVSGLPWLYSARGILELGFQTSLIWRRGGIPSTHLLPPLDVTLRKQLFADFDRSHPLVSWISPDLLDLAGMIESIAERPIDIFSVGNATRLRTQFFLHNAAYLAQKSCFLPHESVESGTCPPDDLACKLLSAYHGVSLLSKCAVNLDRFPIGHFQWGRNIGLGLSCGTPVVTTPCLRTPFFKPNVHYFEAPLERLSTLIRWLVDSADGLSRARAAAYRGRRVLENQLSAGRVGRHVLSFLADLPP
jgi:hypothetical protein